MPPCRCCCDVVAVIVGAEMCRRLPVCCAEVSFQAFPFHWSQAACQARASVSQSRSTTDRHTHIDHIVIVQICKRVPITLTHLNWSYDWLTDWLIGGERRLSIFLHGLPPVAFGGLVCKEFTITTNIKRCICGLLDAKTVTYSTHTYSEFLLLLW